MSDVGPAEPKEGEGHVQDFEKLGVFYLGRRYDLATRARQDDLVLYDSKDLVTHGVCVGMTGSGKTGLCLSILEEAAIDGIPFIAVDPKGDLGNLMLTFPRLAPGDFRPWINEDEARRRNLSPDDYASEQAQLWQKGLAEWGEDGDRIRRMREAADFAIYTPGSTAGLPISILRSLAPPSAAICDDAELLGERVATTVTSLLTLTGVEADPVTSREHILLSTLVARAWHDGQALDLAALIQQVQSPPVARVGVLELEAFYPARDRFELAMRMNNLLAAPGFQTWTEGEPLDVGHLLYTPQGKPRASIVSIAHLGERERMFFVSLLLNEVLSWVRTQSGTSSLRAILYMDEIFGFFPPVANPPSKPPLLTLLKQARAYGLGVLLATQNPVDLDYKGLANTGTWLLGRLQTERDKARVLDGLEGAMATAGAAFDRGAMDRTLSALSTRVFLMHNVHESAPEVFETRWAMSYLRGPMTRDDIRRVMAERKLTPPTPEAAHAAITPPPIPVPAQAPPPVPPSRAASPAPADAGGGRPVLPPDVPQYYLPVRERRPGTASLVYEPRIFGAGTVRFSDARTGVSESRQVVLLAPLPERTVTVAWEEAEAIDLTPDDLESEPPADSRFSALPASAARAKSYTTWSKGFEKWLTLSEQLALLHDPATGEVSKPGESERDFRIRLQTSVRERRDESVAALREKYAAQAARLAERRRRAAEAVERETAQASQQKLQTAVSLGATVLGALLGRRTVSLSTLGRATTTARGVGRTMKETQDIKRATEEVQAIDQEIAALDAQLQAEIGALDTSRNPATAALETVALKPKRGDVTVQLITLAWRPGWEGDE